MTVKVLTSKVPSDFVLEARKFVKQHSQFTLELRKTKDFHDRFIILDEAKCYLIGASIKDAGSEPYVHVYAYGSHLGWRQTRKIRTG